MEEGVRKSSGLVSSRLTKLINSNLWPMFLNTDILLQYAQCV